MVPRSHKLELAGYLISVFAGRPILGLFLFFYLLFSLFDVLNDYVYLCDLFIGHLLNMVTHCSLDVEGSFS